jgi:hypothetical protein
MASSSLIATTTIGLQNKTEEEDHMSHKIARLPFWLIPALFVSLCPLGLHAQETPAQEKAEHKAAQQTVTGCLQKGATSDEFSITGEDGKTWELRSRSVKLAEHVGHKVTVTGFRHHETKAEEAKEAKMEKKDNKEAGEKENAGLRVTSLKMISESCAK